MTDRRSDSQDRGSNRDRGYDRDRDRDGRGGDRGGDRDGGGRDRRDSSPRRDRNGRDYSRERDRSPPRRKQSRSRSDRRDRSRSRSRSGRRDRSGGDWIGRSREREQQGRRDRTGGDWIGRSRERDQGRRGRTGGDWIGRSREREQQDRRGSGGGSGRGGRRGWEAAQFPSYRPPASSNPPPLPADAAPPLPDGGGPPGIQSFDQVLAEVKQKAAAAKDNPSQPVRPLYHSGIQVPGANGELEPEATPSALKEAMEKALELEAKGLHALRSTGIVPKGPPDMPTGSIVIEQKYVTFVIGPSGQSLAAINYAAGVTVIMDQDNKDKGYSFANIYGPEHNTKHAKLAIEFKVKQWRPKPGSGGPPRPGQKGGGTPSTPSGMGTQSYVVKYP